MRKKDEIALWKIEDMIHYVAEFYKMDENSDDFLDREESYKAQIRRTLSALKFIPEDMGSTKTYYIAQPIAEYIINTMLYDYFIKDVKNPKKNIGKKIQKQREKRLKELEAISYERDKQISQKSGVMGIVNIMDKMVKDPTQNPQVLSAVEEKINSFMDKSTYHLELSDGTKIDKSSFKYNIPDLTLDELDENAVNEIIDRMMIRALFDMFFEFNETEFRNALFERALRIREIQDGTKRFDAGYSELTHDLEQPLNKYIFLKKEKEKKKSKSNSTNQK